MSGLEQVRWLTSREIHYWGDIDTHGFGILDELRAFLPNTKSFLMDEKTLHEHKLLWGHEDPLKSCARSLPRLTQPEYDVFRALRENKWGERIRLEQERIAFGWIEKALRRLPS